MMQTLHAPRPTVMDGRPLIAAAVAPADGDRSLARSCSQVAAAIVPKITVSPWALCPETDLAVVG